MIVQTFLGEYAFIWLFVIVVVLIYAALKKANLPGSEWVLAITAFLVGFILLSSTKATEYLIAIVPYITVLIVATFLVTLFLVLLTGGAILENFKKYMAWAGFVIAAIIIVYLAFNHFPTLAHMTPNSSNAGLDSSSQEFKNFIYSQNFKESIIFIISIVVVGFFILKTTVKK